MDLRRESLLDRIQSSSAQLILAQAPAGYGKSSLLRQLAATEVESGGAVGWITPVSQDGDLSRFVQMFIRTCERLIEDTGGKLRRTTRDIPTLISAINGPALLLLDEYDQFAHGQADALLGSNCLAGPLYWEASICASIWVNPISSCRSAVDWDSRKCANCTAG